MGVHHLHGGGLADNHGAGLWHVVADVGHQRAHALAAHFLIAGERQMDGRFQIGCLELRHQGQGHGDEALHVTGAAAIEPAVPLGEFKGIAGPCLAVDRHHVGMARQHNAAGDIGADGGEEIGFLSRLIIDAEMRNVPAVEIVFDKFDQGNVAIAAGGVKAHEIRQHGLGRIIIFHFFNSRCVRHRGCRGRRRGYRP